MKDNLGFLMITLALTLSLLAGCETPAFTQPEQLPGSATIQPLPVEVCNGLAQAMAQALNVLEVTQSEEPLEDFVSGIKGIGCQATATGSGAQFESPEAAVNALGSMLIDQGWTKDPALKAGSRSGLGAGYRKGDQICLAVAVWWPDESANCPEDKIPECQVPPEKQVYNVTLNCGLETEQG